MDANESMLVAVARAAGLDRPVSAPAPRANAPVSPAAAQEFQPTMTPAASARQPAPKAVSFHEQVIADWKANAAIRAEFGSLAAYAGWREHDHRQKTGATADQLRSQHPDVTAYITHLEKAGRHVSPAEKLAINGYAETWRASAEIRAEFGTFGTFAAYMRAKASGHLRVRP